MSWVSFESPSSNISASVSENISANVPANDNISTNVSASVSDNISVEDYPIQHTSYCWGISQNRFVKFQSGKVIIMTVKALIKRLQTVKIPIPQTLTLKLE